MTARSALMQAGVRAILVGARAKASLSPIDSWEKRLISALTGLHCKTKLHSTTEADSVPTSQCKRDIVSVRERSSGKGIQQRRRHRQPEGKTGPKSR
jgi:hypothetical protein